MNPDEFIARLCDGTHTKDDEEQLLAYAAMMGLSEPEVIVFARDLLPRDHRTVRDYRNFYERWHIEYLYVVALHMRETLNGGRGNGEEEPASETQAGTTNHHSAEEENRTA